MGETRPTLAREAKNLGVAHFDLGSAQRSSGEIECYAVSLKRVRNDFREELSVTQ